MSVLKENKQFIFILLVFFFIIQACSSGEKAYDQRIEKVDELFAKWDKPDSPGCALGVIKDGKFLYKRGYGMANLEYDIPITSKSIFRIGSTSKQFTAMCISLLAEDGKILLDDNIRKYFPKMPEYAEDITIRHLILHTSGIRDYLTLWEISGARNDDYFTDEEVVDLLCHQKELNFYPGEEHLYSNSGYFLLSEIVKRVTGKSMKINAEENIFKPLGMKNTHFHNNHTKIVKLRASGYSPRDDNSFRIDMTTLPMIGDGGIFTSVDDLLLWDQNFYHNKLGKGGQELIEKILTPGVLNSGEKLKYAFGLDIDKYRGLKMISHGGSFVGFRADMIRFPEQNFSVICLANLGSFDPSRLARKVADIYLADEFKENVKKNKVPAERPEFIKLSESELIKFSGTFHDPKRGVFWKLSPKENSLQVQVNFSPRTFLISPISKTKFYTNDPFYGEIEFKISQEGTPPIMLVLWEGRDISTFKIIRLELLSPAQLKEYTGSFYSEELQTTYEILLENGKLYIRHENPYKDYPEDALTPTFKDKFIVNGLKLNFFRSQKGDAVSFTVDAGRVKNIRFAKTPQN